MIGLIDYGVGNLFSLVSSFGMIGEAAEIVRTPEEVRRADKLILPGVGAFGDARQKLAVNGMDEALTEAARRGTPILGICLGMQMLFDTSDEFGKHEGLLPHLWETLFVMLTFLLLIKPLRENCRFFMLQFNSMDRPEDRPHTLKWIILGNLLPGLLLSVTFQNFFENKLHEPYLVMIIVLAVSIGDGLAEPIGKYLGKHKYTVPAWNFKRRYTRSYEGSACVFFTTLIAIFIFHGEFDTARQFIAALVILPPLMTFAEAFAPHSMDTPLMMLSGYTVLAGICCWNWF